MNCRAKALSFSVIIGMGPRNARVCVSSRGLGAREKIWEGEKGNANSYTPIRAFPSKDPANSPLPLLSSEIVE